MAAYSIIREGVYRRAPTGQILALTGLYKGVSLSAAVIVPYLAISFAVYDELKQQLPDDKASRATWWHPTAMVGMGATAGIVAQVSHETHSSCLVSLLARALSVTHSD